MAGSASGGSDEASRSLLLALSHDELGVIVDGLADPLQPVVAVAFSSTCKGLRTPLGVALEVLKQRHERANELCCKLRGAPCSCVVLRDKERLMLHNKGLNADDVATIGMILSSRGLPRLTILFIARNHDIGDAGINALCEGLVRGSAPSLRIVNIHSNQFGPAGAEALATALGRGALPALCELYLNSNSIGNHGIAALAASLRRLPALSRLYLSCCDLGDEGVASLVADLGKDDFKALEVLSLGGNKITDAGMAKLVAAINAGGLPKLKKAWPSLSLGENLASAPAVQAVIDALARRSK